MKKGLRGKFQNKKGFTLVEMLIVVAIIAILIAVSIPLVSTSLEKAREAVDDANKRAAISLGNIFYLTGDLEAGESFSDTNGVTRYYSINEQQEGSLVKDKPTKPYGQGTSANIDEDNTKSVIKVVIKEPTDADDPIVTATWDAIS